MKKITDCPFRIREVVCVRESTDAADSWSLGRIDSLMWTPLSESPKVIDEHGNWHTGTAGITLYNEPSLTTFVVRRGNPDFGEALWSELYPTTAMALQMPKRRRLSWLAKSPPKIAYRGYAIPPEVILINRLEMAHPHPEKLLKEKGKTITASFDDICPADPWNFRNMFNKKFFSTHSKVET